MTRPPLHSGERQVFTVGFGKGPWQSMGMHLPDCKCESCGPAYLVMLTDYEARHLLDALERRDGADKGDWHGQIRNKLAAVLEGEVAV